MSLFFKKAGLVVLAFVFKFMVLVLIGGPFTIFYSLDVQWQIFWGMITVLSLIDTIRNYKNAWIFLEGENK